MRTTLCDTSELIYGLTEAFVDAVERLDGLLDAAKRKG